MCPRTGSFRRRSPLIGLAFDLNSQRAVVECPTDFFALKFKRFGERFRDGRLILAARAPADARCGLVGHDEVLLPIEHARTRGGFSPAGSPKRTASRTRFDSNLSTTRSRDARRHPSIEHTPIQTEGVSAVFWWNPLLGYLLGAFGTVV